MKIAYEFSNVMRSARKSKNMKQKELASITHMARGNISNYEMGNNIPRLDNAQVVLNALGYDLQIVRLE